MQTTRDESTLEFDSKIFSTQSHQFWTLQISGWIGYAIVVFLAIVRPQFASPDFNLIGQILNLGIETISGIALCYLQWGLIRKTVHMPLKSTLFISFFSAAVMGLIFNVIKLASYKSIVYGQVWYEQWNMLEFGGWFLFSTSTMFVWTAIFFIMLYNTKLQREHEMLLRAQTSAKEAQLQMLRYQLNPHFMFNTMNAISTLIYKKDNDRAGEMLDKLCAFFRYSLDEKAGLQSTLKKELELLDLYLCIEKVRFEKRLSVELEIEPEALTAKVPTLFLQPIVENAIKHGIESRKGDGQIHVLAKVLGAKVVLSVRDNGAGEKVQTEKGFGIGLSNTRERLSTLFNDSCELTVNSDQNGTLVRIVFPFHRVGLND